jgi:hypothetical protein
MFLITVAVSVLLAAALVYSAVLKLGHRETVVATYARAGVPEEWLSRLAVVLLAAAAGLVAGLVWVPLGIATAAGVVCYFGVAITFHVRARDTGNLATPVTLAVIAAVDLALLIATR